MGGASLLRSKGVEVLYENSNVGENLQDHVLPPLAFEAAPGEATFESLRDETVLRGGVGGVYGESYGAAGKWDDEVLCFVCSDSCCAWEG